MGGARHFLGVSRFSNAAKLSMEAAGELSGERLVAHRPDIVKPETLRRLYLESPVAGSLLEEESVQDLRSRI